MARDRPGSRHVRAAAQSSRDPRPGRPVRPTGPAGRPAGERPAGPPAAVPSRRPRHRRAGTRGPARNTAARELRHRHLSPDPHAGHRQRPAGHRAGARTRPRRIARAGARRRSSSAVPLWARLCARLQLRTLSVGRWPRGCARRAGARRRAPRRRDHAVDVAVRGARRGRRPGDRVGLRGGTGLAGGPARGARLGLGAADRDTRGLEDQAAAARRQRGAFGPCRACAGTSGRASRADPRANGPRASTNAGTRPAGASSSGVRCRC